MAEEGWPTASVPGRRAGTDLAGGEGGAAIVAALSRFYVLRAHGLLVLAVVTVCCAQRGFGAQSRGACRRPATTTAASGRTCGSAAAGASG